MHDRFLELLHPSAEKTLRNLLQSGEDKKAWDTWSELLHERGEELAIREYRRFLEDAGLAPTEPLERAVDLVLETKTWKPTDWFSCYEKLIALVSEIKEAASLEGQLRGELGWLCGLLFPELKPSKAACEKGRGLLIEGLEELLDGAGLPDSEHFANLRSLLGCWTRCLALGKRADFLPWKTKSQRQYEWAIQQTLRFTRKDGSQVFGPEFADKSASLAFRRLIEQALALDSDLEDREIAQAVLPGRKTPAGSKKETVLASSGVSYFSDWSQIALLRSGWSHELPGLAVSYGRVGDEPNDAKPFAQGTDGRVRIELNLKAQTVLSGFWDIVVSRNGRRFEPVGDWAATCDVSEPTHDYLELELSLSGGFRLQRHFFLAHEEELLILADSILREADNVRGPFAPGDRIEYESRLPLGPAIRSRAGKPQGTDRLLFSNRAAKEVVLARVLPPSLAEQETDAAPGALCADDDALVLRLSGEGNGLFAPLVFDLHGSRTRYPYTWRQLTVGEKLEKVPREKAAGFRVQLFKDQYLLYRSLTAPTNRTVLGHNLVSDFFLGRFDKETGIETILDVEIDEEE